MDSIFAPPTPVLIIATILIALIPIILHFAIFRVGANASLPTFLVLGPSGSGKTSLCLWFKKGEKTTTPTHTSQTALSLECDIPASMTASAKYRSTNDPSLSQEHTKFLVMDTPGHAKLRHIAYEELKRPGNNIKGLIFVLDSAEEMAKAAEYLHDVLLALQKAGGKKKMRLLVACNKNDLFTALPASRIKTLLEKEITKTRESRSKGLMDSGVTSTDGVGADDENEWLGEGGEGEFKMEVMEEVGVEVSLKGGSVETGECEYWRQWVGSCL
ncbi:signal recognition particle receptor beta subunit-domain-containing protein [Kalaharituber pfeilii]|nr:signal recognition particle receptor beta subunit-domain-containing protein [Kalaharituber pfeilii]